MKYIGHSLVGDFLYGKKSELIDRQAFYIVGKFNLYILFLKMLCTLEGEIPEDMKRLCSIII